MVFGEDYWRATLVGFPLEARTGLRQVLADDHGHVRLYYSGLLSRYQREGVAEKLCVVETDVGDYRQFGRDDVGAIEPAAEADFYYRHVDLLLLEIEKRQRRGKLKERRVEGFEELALLLHEVDDPPFGNHLPVDAYALTEVYEMGRCVQADLVASLLQDGRYAVRARALAIGAGYVYGLVGGVWVVEMLVQCLGGLEPRFISRSPYVLEHWS